MLKILDTYNSSAFQNMLLDEQLLDNLESDPILHFYDFLKPSITYGYFIDIGKYINLDIAKEKDIDISKRPTGGGIVFHIWDIAFSFLMPQNNKFFFLDTLKNYQFVNNIVLKAVLPFLKKTYLIDLEDKNAFSSFCMAKKSKYDLIYNNKKIAGAAQRRKKNGYLHQTSISLVSYDKNLLNNLIKDKNIVEAILSSSTPIFNNANLEENKALIKENLIKELKLIIS